LPQQHLTADKPNRAQTRPPPPKPPKLPTNTRGKWDLL
jgi:hypothetical protein